MRVGEGEGVVLVERALVTTGGSVFLEMELWVFGGDSLLTRGVEGIIITTKGRRYSLVSLCCVVCNSIIRSFDRS